MLLLMTRSPGYFHEVRGPGQVDRGFWLPLAFAISVLVQRNHQNYFQQQKGAVDDVIDHGNFIVAEILVGPIRASRIPGQPDFAAEPPLAFFGIRLGLTRPPKLLPAAVSCCCRCHASTILMGAEVPVGSTGVSRESAQSKFAAKSPLPFAESAQAQWNCRGCFQVQQIAVDALLATSVVVEVPLGPTRVSMGPR